MSPLPEAPPRPLTPSHHADLYSLAQEFEAGDLIFKDPPLAAIQHTANAAGGTGATRRRPCLPRGRLRTRAAAIVWRAWFALTQLPC